jgi:hypothetical protein
VNGHHHSHHNEYDALYGGPLYVGGRHSTSPPPPSQQLSSADANANAQLATLTAFSASSVASPMDYSVAGLKWNELAKFGNSPFFKQMLWPHLPMNFIDIPPDIIIRALGLPNLCPMRQWRRPIIWVNIN